LFRAAATRKGTGEASRRMKRPPRLFWAFGLVVLLLVALNSAPYVEAQFGIGTNQSKSGLSYAKKALVDDHPFEARWIAAELARYGAEITAIVPASGPPPPRPDILIGKLLRNRVGSWDLTTMGTPASPEMLDHNPRLLQFSVTRFRLRDAAPGDATYYMSYVMPEEREASPWYLGYDLFAACAGAVSGSGERRCQVTLTPELTNNEPTKLWLALTIPESRADDLFAIGRYALELAYAPVDARVTLPNTQKSECLSEDILCPVSRL